LDYLNVIQHMTQDETVMGTRWLQGVVDDVLVKMLELFPSLT
jgi:hypothetical protein